MHSKLSKINLNNYKPLRDVIFDSLREAIIAGELKPGERLMEVQLAEKMGVSRTPVREAIRKLELEGWVVMTARKGASVANLSVKDIMDVLEVRAALDGEAAFLSAVRIREDELKEIKNIEALFEKSVEKGNFQDIVKKDVEFHEVIYKSSRNDKLMQIVSNLREQVHRFRIIYTKDYSITQNLVKEHIEILEAIASRDAKKAQKAAYAHIENQKEAIVKSIKKT
ncbi:MAG TPA: GntR family transcriptional regulator [Pseudobacteroides sp.]|uniref:GntR family transcriptional regulator n=1 Tax=Pseudobacteroides sp. TaxID=1968840 RepID=UPI002F935EF9